MSCRGIGIELSRISLRLKHFRLAFVDVAHYIEIRSDERKLGVEGRGTRRGVKVVVPNFLLYELHICYSAGLVAIFVYKRSLRNLNL